MKISIFRAGALAMAMTLASGCQDLKPVKGKGSASTASSGPKVKLEMYVMSKCPFGVEAENGIKPVIDEIGDRIDFHLDFIVSEANGAFTALHGEPEVKGNILQLCAIKQAPEAKKYMKFVDCQNQNMGGIPDGWERCADQAELDKGQIKSCSEGSQGKDLLRESMKRATAAGAQGSPTIKLAGTDYNGGRSKIDFMRALCEKMPGDKPEACKKIPEPVAVTVTVVTDKRCKECQTAGLESNLRGRFFPKLTVKTVDYADAEGKRLYKELDLKHLPVWLFEAGVEKSERYSTISRWMMDKGKYKMLRIPANFDPTAEICDNKIDDTGDGKVDCDDKTCQATLTCRKEVPKKVEVFIMSQCPFGVQAVDAMKEVLDNFKGKVAFDVHYIADKTPTGFSALHGQPEVDENIRQLCAKKLYGKKNKYLDYMWCRNKNYRSDDWKPCAKDGIVAAAIEKCSTGDEGKKLLEEDIKIAKQLEISGSPTWLANNRFKFSGVAADAIKQNICQHNKDLANCDKKLTEQAKAQGSCN